MPAVCILRSQPSQLKWLRLILLSLSVRASRPMTNGNGRQTHARCAARDPDISGRLNSLRLGQRRLTASGEAGSGRPKAAGRRWPTARQRWPIYIFIVPGRPLTHGASPRWIGPINRLPFQTAQHRNSAGEINGGVFIVNSITKLTCCILDILSMHLVDHVRILSADCRVAVPVP